MKQKQRKPKPNSRPPQKKVPVRKKRRRRGRNLLYYIMFTMIAVAVGLILSLTVFFKRYPTMAPSPVGFRVRSFCKMVS